MKTRKLLRNVFLPADGKRHILNAVALDRAGDLYVSDTGASGIYLLQPGSDSLKTFVPSNIFHATQGLAFSEDEKTLYVVDYTNGLWALDMAPRKPRHLEARQTSGCSGSMAYSVRKMV